MGGKIYVVGIGPGHPSQRTFAAIDAIAKSEVVVGYETYIKLVEDLLGAYKAKKWTYYDAEGLVYGHPSVVEADLLVRDGEHILVEFKSSADRADVGELYASLRHGPPPL